MFTFPPPYPYLPWARLLHSLLRDAEQPPTAVRHVVERVRGHIVRVGASASCESVLLLVLACADVCVEVGWSRRGNGTQEERVSPVSPATSASSVYDHVVTVAVTLPRPGTHPCQVKTVVIVQGSGVEVAARARMLNSEESTLRGEDGRDAEMEEQLKEAPHVGAHAVCLEQSLGSTAGGLADRGLIAVSADNRVYIQPHAQIHSEECTLCVYHHTPPPPPRPNDSHQSHVSSVVISAVQGS